VTAQSIRYRRELKLFETFQVYTKIINFSDEDKCFYVESRFINSANFVCAVHHLKYKIVGVGMPLISDLLAEAASNSAIGFWDVGLYGKNDNKFVRSWNEANLISSIELNPKKQA